MAHAQKSKREQLADLMGEVAEDQAVCIREAAAYLGSAEAKSFRDRIEGFQKRTVPGQHFDMIFGSLLQVINSTSDTTRQLVELEQAPKTDVSDDVKDNPDV